MKEKETSRSSFTGKLGFVLAAAGSAVGLGNLWRFPYLAAQYGGGIFLLVYVILAFTFGFTLMTTEIAIGRKTGKSAISAFGALDKRFAFIGGLSSIVPVIITPYYCVIGGWVTKYLGVYLSARPRKTAISARSSRSRGSRLCGFSCSCSRRASSSSSAWKRVLKRHPRS